MKDAIERLYNTADGYAIFLTKELYVLERNHIKIGHGKDGIFPSSGNPGVLIDYSIGKEYGVEYDYVMTFYSGATRVTIECYQCHYRINIPRGINEEQLDQLVDDLNNYLDKIKKPIDNDSMIKEKLKELSRAKEDVAKIEQSLKYLGHKLN